MNSLIGKTSFRISVLACLVALAIGCTTIADTAKVSPQSLYDEFRTDAEAKGLIYYGCDDRWHYVKPIGGWKLWLTKYQLEKQHIPGFQGFPLSDNRHVVLGDLSVMSEGELAFRFGGKQYFIVED